MNNIPKYNIWENLNEAVTSNATTWKLSYHLGLSSIYINQWVYDNTHFVDSLKPIYLWSQIDAIGSRIHGGGTKSTINDKLDIFA